MINPYANIIKTVLGSKDLNKVFETMMQTNPYFQKFVNDNKGKSIDQIAKENNVDLNFIRQFLK